MAARPPRGAVVLGADYRALGVARSLGRRGIPVWMLAASGEPLASLSRYVQRTLPWPSDTKPGQVDYLSNLAVLHGLRGWALIPSADESAAFIARHYDKLALSYTHTIPSWEVVRWAYDKRLTYALAARVGVPYPLTAIPRRQTELTDLNVPFPAVLKPAIKDAANPLNTAKAWPVNSRDELARRFAEACEFTSPELLMVQEVIPGGGEMQFSYAALCRDGAPLAWLTARRTRQYPARFGRASTFVETVSCPEALEPSIRLLHELRYTGLIEIEYKRDSRDGGLKLLDVNPRVWGWHTLCGRAGVDFPWLLWLLVSGHGVPAARARLGVRWLRVSTDTPTAARELLRRRLSVREYRRSLRGPRESAIFAWDDPLPGFAELPLLGYVAARRLLEGRPV